MCSSVSPCLQLRRAHAHELVQLGATQPGPAARQSERLIGFGNIHLVTFFGNIHLVTYIW